MRRSDHMNAQLRDVEIDRRLRGRSEMEAELAPVEAETARRLGTLGLDDLPAAEDVLAEGGGARRPDRAADAPSSRGSSARSRPRRSPAMRDAAALEVAEKASALEALGPIAKEPRARERLEVEVRDQESALEHARDDEANARARVEANPVDAEQVAGQAERLAVWREQLAALQRRERVYALTLARSTRPSRRR